MMTLIALLFVSVTINIFAIGKDIEMFNANENSNNN